MTTALVPATNMAELDTYTPQDREVAITGMLDQARTWLAHAVESSAPAQDIANFKAYIATAVEAARQLKVSKEIRVDAEVMVRRFEHAVVGAIREGQERGEIETMAEARARAGSHQTAVSGLIRKPRPTDFEPNLYSNGSQILAMADGVTPEQFDEALTRALDEQNVSRANVVRKVREVESGAEAQQEKWARVAEMAEHGHASAQIARALGVGESGLRQGARDRGIDIRADRILGNARRLDMRRVIEQTVLELESIAETTNNLISVAGIRAADIEAEEIQTWVDSLSASIRALTKARNTIKESIS